MCGCNCPERQCFPLISSSLWFGTSMRPAHSLMSYLLSHFIFSSPKHRKAVNHSRGTSCCYRWRQLLVGVICDFQIFVTVVDFTFGVLLCPVLLFPAPASLCEGLICQMGFSSHIGQVHSVQCSRQHYLFLEIMPTCVILDCNVFLNGICRDVRSLLLPFQIRIYRSTFQLSSNFGAEYLHKKLRK